MNRIFRCAICFFLAVWFGVVNAAGVAVVMSIDGAIGPATADYLQRGIAYAQKQSAELVVIKIDTPGGLDSSTRSIIKSITASNIPIVTYVASSGARAASAGTFILYASHVAAMAPGTNLGAATPVGLAMGGKEAASTNKVKNDAVAYIRSLAQLRQRDVKFAEDAVNQAATLTANEAKQRGVVEFIAVDLDDLLAQMDGLKLTVSGKTLTLQTKILNIQHREKDWRSQFLAVITDPSVAYILLLIGIYGLFFEFSNPGFIVPGVVGAIALVIALYAFQMLPISYAGLGLLLLGIIFIVAEVFMPSFGALGIGGIIAFIVGSVLLMDGNLPGYQIAWQLVVEMSLVNALFFFIVMGMAVRAKAKTVITGMEALLYREGTALEDISLSGQAKIKGEIWQVQSFKPIIKGRKLRVTKVKGLILMVEEII